MITELLNDLQSLGALKIIGIVGTIILSIAFLSWLATKIVCMTNNKYIKKQMMKNREREILFEQEMHYFVAEEVRRLLVEKKQIEDTKGRYNFGADGLRIE